jgi:RNA polymerase-binding transcription factor DksA
MTSRIPPYSESFLEETRRRLIELRTRLTDDDLAEAALRPVDQGVSLEHPAEYGSDAHEQELNLGLLEEESVRIQQIDEAMARVDGRGHRPFGLCEECEDEPKRLCRSCPWIAEERLRAVPWARNCTAVQERLDGGEEEGTRLEE